MSKLLFAGSRTECVRPIVGTISDTTEWVDPAFCDAGIRTQSGGAIGILTDPAAAPLLAPYQVEAPHSFYFHTEFAWNDTGFANNYVALTLLDSDGYPWVRLYWNGVLQYNDGTGPAPVWTQLGVPYGQIGGFQFPVPFDIKLDLSFTGDHTILLAYANTAVIGPITFSQPLLTNIAAFELTGVSTTRDTWSQIMCTEDISTIGAHVKTCRATGPGTYSGWSGTYTDVNEVIPNDSTVNQASTVDLLQSYPVTNIAVADGYEVIGVFHNLRSHNNGTAPENVASIVRGAPAVDRISGDLTGSLVTFGNVGARYDVNPDTNTPWTSLDWNFPVEFGFKSKA